MVTLENLSNIQIRGEAKSNYIYLCISKSSIDPDLRVLHCEILPTLRTGMFGMIVPKTSIYVSKDPTKLVIGDSFTLWADNNESYIEVNIDKVKDIVI